MKPRPEAKIIEVPPELHGRFRDDTDAALRNLAGVGTNSISPFIRDPKQALRAIMQDYKNPFPLDSLPICLGNSEDLCDLLDLQAICQIEEGRWRPRFAPDRPRHLHLDLAINQDAAGIGMGFNDGYRRVERYNDSDGTKQIVAQPIIRLDLLQRIHSEPNSEIDFDKIFTFIVYLNQFFTFQEVTMDGFQSRYMMQRLTAHGITTRLLSLDRTTGPYMGFRGALREGRLLIPHTEEADLVMKQRTHPWFHKETTNLHFDPKLRKVDHPDFNPDGSPGSKDVTDCAAGVTDGIMSLLEKTRGGGQTRQATHAHDVRQTNAQDEWQKLRANVPRR